jgi:hypothetical protein
MRKYITCYYGFNDLIHLIFFISNKIDILYFDHVTYCEASWFISDSDGTCSLSTSYGFRLSMSENSSLTFSTIDMGYDSNYIDNEGNLL